MEAHGSGSPPLVIVKLVEMNKISPYSGAVDNSGGCHDDRKLHRFMVTGNITGGHLKTPAEADKESIQVFRQGTKSWRRKIHHVNHVNCMSVSIKPKNHTQSYHHHHHPNPHKRAYTQAKWIKDLSDLPLRASDVIRLVKRGREYQTGKKTLS